MKHGEKLRAAIEWMGERYVLHPVNRVKRGNYEHPVQKVDLAATFARITGKPLVEVHK